MRQTESNDGGAFYAGKGALLGRFVFGASAVLFGVIALMWRDPDTWQSLQPIWGLPFGSIIGECLMIVQIGGGIGIQYPRTARLGSLLLCFVYSCFSLVCITRIITAPSTYAQYPGFFEQLSLLSGSIALYAATETNETRTLTFGRLARLGVGVCAISFALSQIVYFRPTVHSVPKWIPPNQMFWAILTTVAFALGGVAILINRQARLALRLLTLMLALFGVLVWVPRLVAQPEAHFNWSEFALTVLIMGAVWMVAELRAL